MTGSQDSSIKIWSNLNSRFSQFALYKESNKRPLASMFFNTKQSKNSITYLEASSNVAELVKVKDSSNNYNQPQPAPTFGNVKTFQRGQLGKIVSEKMDENQFLTGSEDGSARFQDKKSGKCLFEIKGNGSAISALEMTEFVIIIGYSNGRVKVFNKQTGQYLTIFREHTRKINKILLINKDQFITVSDDCTAKLVNLLHSIIPHLISVQTFACNSGMVSNEGDKINDVAVDSHMNVYLGTSSGFVHRQSYPWQDSQGMNPTKSQQLRQGVESLKVQTQRLICGLSDGSVDVRSIKSGLSINKFKGHTHKESYLSTLSTQSSQSITT